MSMQKGFVKTDLTIEKTEKQPICRRTKWQKIPAKGIFWKLVGKRLEVVLFCLRRDSCNYTDCNIWRGVNMHSGDRMRRRRTEKALQKGCVKEKNSKFAGMAAERRIPGTFRI